MVEKCGNWPGWSGEEDGNLKGLQRDRLQTDRLRATGDQKKNMPGRIIPKKYN